MKEDASSFLLPKSFVFELYCVLLILFIRVENKCDFVEFVYFLLFLSQC